MSNNSKIITVDDRSGKDLSIAGNAYQIIISGSETDGKFAIIDMLVPPGGGPVPHAHPDFQESFFVLEGEVEFKSETEKYTAKKGAFISIPLNGPIHCFKNTSNENARLLCTVVPSGLEEFFTKVAAVTANLSGPPDDNIKQKLSSLSEKYGQTIYPPDFLD
ncbi:MAG: cupin domain-containing protein [Flavobacterium sp.]|nr:cupin domain-containing protein [Flavobacterium sp.]